MKGLIIINSFTSSPAISYKAWRLMSEFRLKGIECDVVKTVDLPVIYKNGIETIPDIDEWGFCVYLDKDKYLIDAIEKRMQYSTRENLLFYVMIRWLLSKL